MNAVENKGKHKDTENFIQILSIIEAQYFALFIFPYSIGVNEIMKLVGSLPIGSSSPT